MAERLFLNDYRVLDIGNLDMEYEWFLQGTKQKKELAKHECVSIEDNIQAGFEEYLDQIVARVVN